MKEPLYHKTPVWVAWLLIIVIGVVLDALITGTFL